MGEKYTYAIAGRNEKKLQAVKDSIDDERADIIIATGDDKSTLVEMCKQAKVLLNCVGPYRVC